MMMWKADVSGIQCYHVEAWFVVSAILLEFEEGLAVELCSLRGHGMRSGGQGTGAGCAMNVGISSPGINTETPLAYTVILGDGWPSFPLNPICDSTSPRSLPVAGDREGGVGLRNLSKIAMTRNMEMRMAVATNPNDTALTELSKCLQCSSRCTFAGAPVGGQLQPLCSPISLSFHVLKHTPEVEALEQRSPVVLHDTAVVYKESVESRQIDIWMEWW